MLQDGIVRKGDIHLAFVAKEPQGLVQICVIEAKIVFVQYLLKSGISDKTGIALQWFAPKIA